ncbi:MAG: hypothetical protein AAGI53_01675 [Planctomycetota bacterium]
MLTAGDILTLTGSHTTTLPPSPDCPDGVVTGRIATYTLETTQAFVNEPGFVYDGDSRSDAWESARPIDIAFRGALRFTKTLSTGGSPEVLEFPDAGVLANAAGGHYLISVNRFNGAWQRGRALMWPLRVQSADVAITPFGSAGKDTLFFDDAGFALIDADDALLLEDHPDVDELHRLGPSGGTLAYTGEYQPQGQNFPPCGPPVQLESSVALTTGVVDDPAGPNTINPLLNPDGSSRFVFEPGGSVGSLSAVISTEALGAVGGARRHTRRLHNRPARRVTGVARLATDGEHEAVREALEVTRGGAVPTRFRTWIDPPPTGGTPVADAPLYRILNAPDIARSLGECRANITLELERVGD